MDLADDVAYSVHDVEDAVAAGRMDLTLLDDAAERRAVVAVVVDWYLPGSSSEALEAAIGRLCGRRAGRTAVLRHPARPGGAEEPHQRAHRTVLRTTEQTLAAHGDVPLTRYAADLEVPVRTREEIAVLKGLAAHYVMRTGDRVTLRCTSAR